MRTDARHLSNPGFAAINLVDTASAATAEILAGLARDAGLEVVSKRLTRDDIYIADEAFFTGTAAEVTPIRELDNRTLGAGVRGPVTTRLQAAYFDVVNARDPRRTDWLSFV